MEAAATAVVHPRYAELDVAEPRVTERHAAWLFAGTGVALFAVMGLAGLAMRLTQAEVLGLSPAWFYRVMTLHGAGMLAGALLAMMGALWYVVRQTVPLSMGRLLTSYVLIVVGAVAVVAATLVGGFAAGWTFLWPLPFHAAGQWSTWATGTFLVGLLLVGAGFFLFCLDVLMKTTETYGGLLRTLGVTYLRGRDDSPPPPQVLAATVVAIEGLEACAAGVMILVALISRMLDPKLTIDALWAKNFTYFFGHSVFNLIIYLAIGAVYVLVPRYAGRPWRTTKPIVVAWLFTLLFVMAAYSHHLYMDFVQPGGLQLMSTFASFGAAIPVGVVTAFTGLMLVWGSRFRWTLASSLVYLGFAGWVIGGTGAVLDSIIPFNFLFHNTLWVVAHFHTYLLLCVIFWELAFVAYLLEEAAGATASRAQTRLALGGMGIGGYGLVGMWYLSGVLGIPRRYAAHPTGTAGYSLAASIFVIVFALGFLVLLWAFAGLARTARARRYEHVEVTDTWSGGRWPVRRRLDEPGAATRPLPRVTEPLGVVFTGPTQLGLAVAAAVVSLAAFFPQVVEASETSTGYHHLDHAGQFLFGALVGAIVASLPRVAARLDRRTADLGIAAVIAVPVVMMLVMLPSLYGPVEDRPALHFLYHVGIAALGLIIGLGAGALGKVTGRIALVLGVSMAVMYAAGVGGG
jgi:cytochrome c oxidase subunit 1